MKKKLLADVLTPKQKTRLDQIFAQMQGPALLTKKAVAEVLGLTDADKKAIDEARRKAVAEIMAFRDKTSDNHLSQKEREAVSDKMWELQDGLTDRLIAALSEEQQKKWRDLVGPKFRLIIERRPAATPAGMPELRY